MTITGPGRRQSDHPSSFKPPSVSCWFSYLYPAILGDIRYYIHCATKEQTEIARDVAIKAQAALTKVEEQKPILKN
jgi:hypothetical protein